jgi:hypothetical protein
MVAMATDCFTIKLPAATGLEKDSPVLVLPTSPKRLRVHVERFARYFLREMHFSSIQFEAAETPSSPGFVKYEAYLFHDGDRFFGACCFRWREWGNTPASWSLDWVWIHPFLRGRGHLKKAWAQFENKYGRFHLAQPVSCGMQIFLRKVGWLKTGSLAQF